MTPAFTTRSRWTSCPFWKTWTEPCASPLLVTTPTALRTSTPAMLPFPLSSNRALWTFRIAAAESFRSWVASGSEASGVPLVPLDEHEARAAPTARATAAAASTRPHPLLDTIDPDATGPVGPGPVPRDGLRGHPR